MNLLIVIIVVITLYVQNLSQAVSKECSHGNTSCVKASRQVAPTLKHFNPLDILKSEYFKALNFNGKKYPTPVLGRHKLQKLSDIVNIEFMKKKRRTTKKKGRPKPPRPRPPKPPKPPSTRPPKPPTSTTKQTRKPENDRYDPKLDVDFNFEMNLNLQTEYNADSREKLMLQHKTLEKFKKGPLVIVLKPLKMD